MTHVSHRVLEDPFVQCYSQCYHVLVHNPSTHISRRVHVQRTRRSAGGGQVTGRTSSCQLTPRSLIHDFGFLNLPIIAMLAPVHGGLLPSGLLLKPRHKNRMRPSDAAWSVYIMMIRSEPSMATSRAGTAKQIVRPGFLDLQFACYNTRQLRYLFLYRQVFMIIQDTFHVQAQGPRWRRPWRPSSLPFARSKAEIYLYLFLFITCISNKVLTNLISEPDLGMLKRHAGLHTQSDLSFLRLASRTHSTQLHQ